MSIILLTEAGSTYGIGHLMRCKSVCDALAEQWKESVFIIDMPANMASLMEGTAHIRCKWQAHKDALLAGIAEASAITSIEGIFVDSYHATRGILAELEAMGIPLYFMDDYNRLEYPIGAIINPTPGAKASVYARPQGRSVYAGLDYMPLRRPFWDIKPLSLMKRRGILITLGGSAPREELVPVVQTIEEYTDEKVTVLTPKNPISADDMVAQIATARVIVCAGGGTLIEAARLGTPAIVIELADNQKNNIKGMTQSGFARFAGHISDPYLPAYVIQHLKALDNITAWRRASVGGAADVDGQGARRIAHIIISGIESGHRRAILQGDHSFGKYRAKNFLNCTDEELDMILETRNTDLVRISSFNKNNITRDQHRAFIESIRKSTTGGYWLVSDNEGYIGVFSLTGADFYYSTAELGYYKMTHCTRKGMGKIIVSLALKTAFEQLKLKSVGADCMDDNIASYKSMEAAGFVLTKTYEDNEHAIMRRYTASYPSQYLSHL